MKRKPPPSVSLVPWAAFEVWADSHQVPSKEEDWQYLWECFFAGWLGGEADALEDRL